jgi:hypothetical protein
MVAENISIVAGNVSMVAGNVSMLAGNVGMLAGNLPSETAGVGGKARGAAVGAGLGVSWYPRPSA